MPRYRGHLSQRIYETATFNIEADSLEDAQALIEDAVSGGEVDWEFGDTDTWNVDKIEELDP